VKKGDDTAIKSDSMVKHGEKIAKKGDSG